MNVGRRRPVAANATGSSRRAQRLAVMGLVLGMMWTAHATACPANADLRARDLLGHWRAQLAVGGASAVLVLERNPEWPDSLAGRIRREGREARVAGDLADGTFTLEESADGVRIDAVWEGQPVEGRCGQEIRGTWRASGQETGREFVLRRVKDW